MESNEGLFCVSHGWKSTFFHPFYMVHFPKIYPPKVELNASPEKNGWKPIMFGWSMLHWGLDNIGGFLKWWYPTTIGFSY